MLSQQQEHVLLDSRRHGVVLVRPFLRALLLAACGIGALALGWPVSAAGGLLLLAAAGVALAAVLRWDRTQVVLTDDRLFVAYGILRRRAAAVRLARVGAVEVDQSLLGRVLGYGTVVAGELEIRCVRKPGRLASLLGRL